MSFNEQVYITQLKIEGVRGLRDISINLDKDKIKHLILTGKNGSGKTSVLMALASYLNGLATDKHIAELSKYIEMDKNNLKNATSENHTKEISDRIIRLETDLNNAKQGIDFTTNAPLDSLYAKFQNQEYIIAFYKTHRTLKATIPKHVSKVELADTYDINATPRQQFVEYLLDLKSTQAFAMIGKKQDKVVMIQQWFDEF